MVHEQGKVVLNMGPVVTGGHCLKFETQFPFVWPRTFQASFPTTINFGAVGFDSQAKSRGYGFGDADLLLLKLRALGPS